MEERDIKKLDENFYKILSNISPRTHSYQQSLQRPLIFLLFLLLLLALNLITGPSEALLRGVEDLEDLADKVRVGLVPILILAQLLEK